MSGMAAVEPSPSPGCYHATVYNRSCDCDAPAPWRFDVPEVPDSVMAFKDRDGKVWCRMHRNQWCLFPVEQYQAKPFSFVLAYAPLAECEDPRKAAGR